MAGLSWQANFFPCQIGEKLGSRDHSAMTFSNAQVSKFQHRKIYLNVF
jgi:hypothetical protein